ncbi:unnamed protein product, partial [Ectocarpus sp. 12 AP-2014]
MPRSGSVATGGGAYPSAVASPTARDAASSAAAESGRRCGLVALDLALRRSGEDDIRPRAVPALMDTDLPFLTNADLRSRPGVMNRGRSGEGPGPISSLPDTDLLRPSLRGGVDRDAELARRAGDSPPR